MNSIKEPIKSIWITGLSSSGKTTLARLLVTRLKEKGYPCLLLDGNETRNLFENKYGFDEASRRKQTRRIIKLAKWTIKQGSIPVVAIIHPFEDDRIRCSKEVPGYYQVYLKCSLKECIRRDQKNVYLPVIQNKKQFVVGLDITYDEALESKIVLEGEKLTAGECLDQLWQGVSDNLVDNRLTQE